ncbi:hypothetical protein e1004f01.tmp0101 [Eimeria tenella]|uniref:Uncharacterized protein n=1 Tax=Eimeria tenella TaxID=5802 RepID=C8TE24_EIMTE|nr:hypothetical protein e1004f01.tmp0101 [Eimeria tenella]
MRFLDAHCSPKEPYSDVDDLAYHRRFVGIRVAVCACRGASCLRAYVRDILNKCVDSCGRYVVVFALGDTLADKNKLSLKSHSTCPQLIILKNICDAVAHEGFLRSVEYQDARTGRDRLPIGRCLCCLEATVSRSAKSYSSRGANAAEILRWPPYFYKMFRYFKVRLAVYQPLEGLKLRVRECEKLLFCALCSTAKLTENNALKHLN